MSPSVCRGGETTPSAGSRLGLGAESSGHRCGLRGRCPGPPAGRRVPLLSPLGAAAPLGEQNQPGLRGAELRPSGPALSSWLGQRGGCHRQPVPFNSSSPSRSGRRPRTPPGGHSGSRVTGTVRQSQGRLSAPARSPAQPPERLRLPAGPHPQELGQFHRPGRPVAHSLPHVQLLPVPLPVLTPACPVHSRVQPSLRRQGVRWLSPGGSWVLNAPVPPPRVWGPLTSDLDSFSEEERTRFQELLASPAYRASPLLAIGQQLARQVQLGGGLL